MANNERERVVKRLKEDLLFAHETAKKHGGTADRSMFSVSDLCLLLSERAELLATVERLRGALEPFAKAGAVWDASASPDAAKVFCDLWDDATAASELGEAAPISDPEFTVGDFIRARAALATGEEK